MSKPKSPDIQKRFERRIDFIFGGRICDDGLKQAMEEDQETVSEDAADVWKLL
jgi:hypothetical protein